MKKEVVLTGIKPTGQPHLGNYLGTIKPAIDLSKNQDVLPIYFVADYHALTSLKDAKQMNQYIYEVAATWLALGLDTNHAIFYRQSDIPEIFELQWILSTLTSKGLMNRAHAYKAIVDRNIQEGLDSDTGVNMGLYEYPILMAADILLFNADIVPVGADQIQHIEIARDLAESFNRQYGDTFVLPSHSVKEEKDIQGLDGRKMSKSYGNTIPLFSDANETIKLVKKIKTDSSLPHEPKDTESSILLHYYSHFATEGEVSALRQKYETGIGWGEVKQLLAAKMNIYLEEPREKFHYLINNKKEIDSIFELGAEKAREYTIPFLQDIKKRIGVT